MFISDLKPLPFLNQCPPARSPGPEPRLHPALLCPLHKALLQGVGEALLERETTFRMSEKKRKKKKKSRRIFPWMDRNAIIKKRENENRVLQVEGHEGAAPQPSPGGWSAVSPVWGPPKPAEKGRDGRVLISTVMFRLFFSNRSESFYSHCLTQSHPSNLERQALGHVFSRAPSLHRGRAPLCEGHWAQGSALCCSIPLTGAGCEPAHRPRSALTPHRGMH